MRNKKYFSVKIFFLPFPNIKEGNGYMRNKKVVYWSRKKMFYNREIFFIIIIIGGCT
jgi:hypothetical protein